MSNDQKTHTDKQLAVIARLDALIERQADHRYEAESIQNELRALKLFMVKSSSPVQAEIDRLAAKGQKIYESLPPSDEPNEFIEMAERGELPYIVPATLTREQALANLAASDDEKAARRQSFVDGPVEPMDLDKLNNLPRIDPEMHEGWNGHIPKGTGGSMKVDLVEKPFPWERDTPETVAHAESIIRKLAPDPGISYMKPTQAMNPEPTVAEHIDQELKRPRNRKTPWWKRG